MRHELSIESQVLKWYFKSTKPGIFDVLLMELEEKYNYEYLIRKWQTKCT